MKMEKERIIIEARVIKQKNNIGYTIQQQSHVCHNVIYFNLNINFEIKILEVVDLWLRP